MRIMKQGAPLQYSSAPTRHFSADSYLGGAQGDEVNQAPGQMYGEVNIKNRFNSGVNKTDLPSCYGPPAVKRSLAGKVFLLQNDITGWMRSRGEPVS